MAEFYRARKDFVKWMTPKVEKITKELKGLCKGVSIIPVDRKSCHGDPCIVLGRERDGVYEGLYNYFGGKTDTFDKETQSQIIAETLFDETAEELGLILDSNLEKCNIHTFIHRNSVLFVVLINDITSEWWNSVIMDRLYTRNIKWKYQEMNKIKHFSIYKLLHSEAHVNPSNSSSKVSAYVKETIEKVGEIFRYNTEDLNNFTVSRNIFKDTLEVKIPNINNEY